MSTGGFRQTARSGSTRREIAAEGDESCGTPPIPYKTHIHVDGVLSSDCDTIGEGEFEGFIVVYSQKELEVVGVLEVEDANEEVEDMEINRVSPIKDVTPLAVWNGWNSAAA